MNLDDPVVQIKLTSSVCTFVAILTTTIRLFIRKWAFWFDDACALFSLVCMTAQLVLILTTSLSYFAAYYCIITTFYSTVWFARLSILLTIIRLGPKERHRHLYVVMILFILLFSVLIGQLFWVCEPQRSQDSGSAICRLTKQIAILKMVSDMVADGLLLVASLHLFLVIQNKALRCRLSFLFSTCVITTAVSLVSASLILTSGGLKVIIVALVEGSTSLIVSNIPILSNIFSHCCDHGTPHKDDIPSSIYFAQNTDPQPQQSPVTTFWEIHAIPLRTVEAYALPADAASLEIQEQYHDPESEPDGGKPTHEL